MTNAANKTWIRRRDDAARAAAEYEASAASSKLEGFRAMHLAEAARCRAEEAHWQAKLDA